jgi:5-methylcytosine-specific restriction endonuclease McrA
MDLFSRPSVEGLRQAIRTKRGVDVSCNVCGSEEFSMEHVAPLDGAGPGYGARRLKRADLVCEGCGHVMGFELEKLRSEG